MPASVATRFRRALAMLCAAALGPALLAGCGGDGEASGERATPPPAIVVLGDSLGRGVQPDPALIGRRAYGRVLRERLRGEFGEAELQEAACGGATTASFIDGGQECVPPTAVPYANRDAATGQLAWAKEALAALGDRPAVVTLTLGGNDAVHCWLEQRTSAAALRGCLEGGLPAVRERYRRIARELKDAAGPRTVLAVGTLYDPALAALRGGDPELRAPARAFHRFVAEQLNPAIREDFGAAGWLVADMGAAVHEREPVDSPSARPVQEICNLTWACENADIHLNDAGYERLGELFHGVVAPALRRASAG